MRTLLAGELAQAQSFDSDYYVKLEVQNGSGTWVDLGAALGKNWIVNASWGEAVDPIVSQVTFVLVQQIGTASLSPLMSTSVLNVDDLLAYAPLLNVGRLTRASVATMAHGVALDVSKYRKFHDGRIDTVTQADAMGAIMSITIQCSDLGGWLMDMQIETSGTQFGTTPVGTALETVLQNVINANLPVGEPAVTLYKQSLSSFAVTDWKQGDTKVMDALQTLVLDSTGEDIRYRYDAAHVSRLTWFNPDRTRTSVDATFTKNQYVLRSLDLALANIRNAGAMPYVGGTATQTSPTSIANFRRRFFRLPSSAMVTTLVDAQRVIDAVVNDLSAPPGEAAADLPFCWFVQLYDRYTFQANNRQFDTDQTFAVMGYRHAIENSRGSTTLTLTARIVGAFSQWLERLVYEGPSPELIDFDWTDSPTARTFTWTRNAATAAIWVYDTLVAVSGGSGWPVQGQLPNGTPGVLLAGTDSYVAPIPPPGFQRFVQMEPRTYQGSYGDIRRSVIGATPLASLVLRARIVSSTDTTVTARVTASDPLPQGASTVTVTYQDSGTGGIVPASGGTITPAATITEAPGTYIDYTITMPPSGSAPGRVTFTAAALGRESAVDAVDVPPIGSSNAQGTVSLETNGSWGAVADGPPNALSFRWSSSTSSFPVDATVTSSGTLVTGTGRFLAISGGPLTFGQTVYLTIIPFSATGGGGTALPAIHLRGSYQSYTATKTANYGIGSFVELNDVLGGAPAHGFKVSGSLNPNGNGTFDPEQVFYSVVILPDRATITDVYADCYSANNGSGGGTAQAHNTSIRFDRVSTTGGITNLGAQAQADNGGWQAGHMGMSELTTGRRYNFYFITSQGSSPATPSNSRIADFSIVYTTPDPSVGL